MSRRKFSAGLIGAGIVVGTVGYAADEVAGPKLSGDVRASWRSTDNGIYKFDGADDPAQTSAFGMERVKIQLKGNLDQDTEYRFRFDFDKRELDYAYATWWISKDLGFKMGQDKIQQGGIYNMTNGVMDLNKPIYAENTPFATYAPMAEVQSKVGGNVALQFFNDKPKSPEWHQVDQQPAMALAYSGDFSGIQPRAQFGMYDNNHSHWLSVGSQFKLAGADAYFNYIYDHRSHKDSATAEDPKDKYDVLSSIELDGKYSVSKQIQPFFHFSMFDRKQEGTDSKVNAVTAASGSTPASYKWDDNGMVIGVGSFYHATEHASPFLAIDMKSGKFPKGFVTGATETESLTETALRIGMAAQF